MEERRGAEGACQQASSSDLELLWEWREGEGERMGGMRGEGLGWIWGLLWERSPQMVGHEDSST